MLCIIHVNYVNKCNKPSSLIKRVIFSVALSSLRINKYCYIHYHSGVRISGMIASSIKLLLECNLDSSIDYDETQVLRQNGIVRI